MNEKDLDEEAINLFKARRFAEELRKMEAKKKPLTPRERKIKRIKKQYEALIGWHKDNAIDPRVSKEEQNKSKKFLADIGERV